MYNTDSSESSDEDDTVLVQMLAAVCDVHMKFGLRIPTEHVGNTEHGVLLVLYSVFDSVFDSGNFTCTLLYWSKYDER